MYIFYTIPTRRVGRPEMDWLTETLKGAYHAFGWIVLPDFNHINVHYLMEAATSRSGPFSRKTSWPSASGLTE